MSNMICCTTCRYFHIHPDKVPCCICKNRSLWSKNEHAAMYKRSVVSPLIKNCASRRGEKTGGM